jgi:capsular exopolysaccharide synthesis family protein
MQQLIRNDGNEMENDTSSNRVSRNGSQLSPAQIPGAQAGLKEALRILKRRRVAFVTTTAIVATMAALIYSILPQRYTARAVVLIKERSENVVNVPSVTPALRIGPDTVESEIQVLRSRDLISRALDHSILSGTPEYNRPSLVSRLCALPGPLGSIVQRVRDCRAAPAKMPQASKVDHFLLNLRTTQSGHSRAIAVTVTAQDPRGAANASNALVDTYVADQIATRAAATGRASDWLGERLDDLHKRVFDAEQKAAAFRAKAGLAETIVQGVPSTIAGQKIADAMTGLSQAAAKMTMSEARLQQIDRLKGSGNGRAAIQLTDEPVLVASYEEVAKLAAKRAEMLTTLGELNPKVGAVEANLAEAKQREQTELERAVSEVSNEVQVDRAHVADLKQVLSQAEVESASESQQVIQLHALESDAAAIRTVYQTYLNRLKELGEQHGLEQADAAVISRAEVPLAPSFPKLLRFAWLALGMSLAAGAGMAFLRENFNSGFVDSSTISNGLALPLLAICPVVRPRRRLPIEVSRLVNEKPFSLAAEAVRSVGAAIMLNALENAASSVLIASSVPGEGKTTLALWLSRVTAQSAQRVLVVDTDFRNPNVHKHFDAENGVGLGDVLAGTARLSTAIRRDDESGVDFLSTGSPLVYAYGRQYLVAFRHLIEEAKRQYDLVLIDSPPIVAVSDALLFSSFADQTIFVCRWNRTAQTIAAGCLEKLQHAGARLTGAVMSMVPLTTFGRFNPEYSRRYMRDLRKYYVS